jgi:hypothetical protein
MVCINRSAVCIRELDVFRSKLGIDGEQTVYEVASENELRWSLEKFLVEDHDLPSGDDR